MALSPSVNIPVRVEALLHWKADVAIRLPSRSEAIRRLVRQALKLK